ncbi:hypothetical protein [Anatilimnocola floriformis]|uniref:hypothetical protein n=1 Tax=Anatilimnocola floriformis TaxID=2948575 RepID=UPI0020C1BAFD|nr:hypothetical protein [Anatilimnocola floriformis]
MPHLRNIPDPAGCSFSRDDKGHRTHVVSWLSEYSDRAIDTPHIVGREQSPQNRSSHASDVKALCVSSNCAFSSLSGRRGIVFKITATFNTDVEPFANPLDEPPVVRWGYTADTKIVEHDVNNVAILNKAGDKFETPVEVEDVIESFTYTFNLPYNPRNLAKTFRNKINDSDWLDFFARTCRCRGIEISERQTAMIPTGEADDKKIYYWTVTGEFAIRDDEWKVRILEQGYRELKGGVLVDIFMPDEDGNPTEERASFPILLDNAGAAQLVGPKVPVYTDWDVIEQADFDSLGIETLEGF